jgi:hypothetical protein
MNTCLLGVILVMGGRLARKRLIREINKGGAKRRKAAETRGFSGLPAM